MGRICIGSLNHKEKKVGVARSNVRAKLRLTVRKILVKYGYPPDLARLEADRVIEQSELLAENLT